jgi:hypothetical protein
MSKPDISMYLVTMKCPRFLDVAHSKVASYSDRRRLRHFKALSLNHKNFVGADDSTLCLAFRKPIPPIEWPPAWVRQQGIGQLAGRNWPECVGSKGGLFGGGGTQ